MSYQVCSQARTVQEQFSQYCLDREWFGRLSDSNNHQMHQNFTALLTSPLSSFGPVPVLSSAPNLPIWTTLVVLLVFAGGSLLRRLARTNMVYNIILRALRQGGTIPDHVAFIMDGNRRWARRFGLPAIKGHPRGGEKLIEALEWCFEVGIQTVTVFAFSTENFKRSAEEVNELMALAERTFHEFGDREHIVHERRVCVRVLGDMRFVPHSLQRIFARVMKDTSCYTDGLALNICFAYSSRFDMATAVRDAVQLCEDGVLEVDDIDEDVIGACLSSGFAKGSPKRHNNCPDLVVRTSGETRLSDFMLWETVNSVLAFYPVLWPDFSVWDLIKILLDYQKTIRLRKKSYSFIMKNQSHNCALQNIPGIDGRQISVGSAILRARSSHFSDLYKVAADVQSINETSNVNP